MWVCGGVGVCGCMWVLVSNRTASFSNQYVIIELQKREMKKKKKKKQSLLLLVLLCFLDGFRALYTFKSNIYMWMELFYSRGSCFSCCCCCCKRRCMKVKKKTRMLDGMLKNGWIMLFLFFFFVNSLPLSLSLPTSLIFIICEIE